MDPQSQEIHPLRRPALPNKIVFVLKRFVISFLLLFSSVCSFAQTEAEQKFVKEFQELTDRINENLQNYENLDAEQRKSFAYDLIVAADVLNQTNMKDDAFKLYMSSAEIFSKEGYGGYDIYYSNVLGIIGAKLIADKDYNSAYTFYQMQRIILKNLDMEVSRKYWSNVYNFMVCYSGLQRWSDFLAEVSEFEKLTEKFSLYESDEYCSFLLMRISICNVTFDYGFYDRFIDTLHDQTIRKHGKISRHYLTLLTVMIEHDVHFRKKDDVFDNIKAAHEILECKDLPITEEDRLSYSAMLHSLEAKAVVSDDPQKAERLFLLALEKDVNDEYGVNNDLGVLYYDYLKDYDKAVRHWNAQKDILEAKGDTSSKDYLACLINIGRYYLIKNDSSKSIAIFDRVAALSEKHYGKSHPLYISAITNLSNFYQSIGYYGKAVEYAKESLQLNEGLYGRNSNQCGQLYYNLGLLHVNMGDFESAEKYILASCEIMKALNSQLLLGAYSILMVMYSRQGRLEECWEMNKKCEQFIEENDFEEYNHVVETYFVAAYEMLYGWNSADSKKPAENLMRSMELNGRTSTVQYLRALSLYAKASFLDKSHEEEMISKLLDSFKSQYVSKFSQYNQTEREALLGDTMVRDVRNILFTSRSTDKYNDELCDYLILSKGLLLETLNLYSQAVNRSGDEKLVESYRQLTELNKYINGETESHPQFSSKNEAISRASLLERDITEAVTERGLLDNSLDISSADVRSRLKDDELVVEFVNYHDYIDDDDFYAAMLISPKMDCPVFIRLCPADKLKDAVSVAPTQLYGDGETSEKGYSLIWKPLETYLENVSTVYFSPSGYLYNVAVEHLYDGKKRLSERVNVVRLSSTRELYIEKRTVEYSSAALYGGLEYDEYASDVTSLNRGAVNGWNYLSGTMDEVLNISSRMAKFDVDTTLYVGRKGSEKSFKNLSGKDVPILHIATHGFYIPESESSDYMMTLSLGYGGSSVSSSMVRSGLVLAGGNRAWNGEVMPDGQDDGILSASEVASVDLNACDIVVLSACETGLGDVTDEGVMGLQRAFKQAGVNTIVMSLWKVDDKASAMLMDDFYGNLLKGQPKRKAFNSAVKKIRKAYPDPGIWAAFVMLD